METFGLVSMIAAALGFASGLTALGFGIAYVIALMDQGASSRLARSMLDCVVAGLVIFSTSAMVWGLLALQP